MTKRQHNDDPKQLLFADRGQWRAWLRKHHGKTTGVWMVYYRGLMAKRGITYEDAIEEALCWGWIDSMIKRVDQAKYLRKFTPRRPGSIWSELNKKRIEKMIAVGRMTKAGLARIESAKKNGDWEKKHVPAGGMDGLPDFVRALIPNRKAKSFFESLTPSYKRQFLGWIGSAKQDATRDRRIKEVISLLRQEKKLGMK